MAQPNATETTEEQYNGFGTQEESNGSAETEEVSNVHNLTTQEMISAENYIENL